VSRTSRLLVVVLTAPLLAQRVPLKPAQIFPDLLYGPDAWSLLRIANLSPFMKSARLDVYRGDGKALQSGRIVTLSPNQSVDIRIEEPTKELALCWARIEDISTNKSGPPLEASARVEHVVGNKLEDFPQHALPPDRTGRWLSPAKAVSNRNLFFLNISDAPTVLEICSVNTFPACSAKPVRTAVKPKQAIILKIGSLRKRALLIRSTPVVVSIIGLLGPDMPTTREYSSESSITFDEPSGK
jgi:hypothetical protein